VFFRQFYVCSVVWKIFFSFVVVEFTEFFKSDVFKFVVAQIPTVFENYTTCVQINNEVISLALWDTAGQVIMIYVTIAVFDSILL
jgi:hypothetical protein